jgi:hypothetical protein
MYAYINTDKMINRTQVNKKASKVLKCNVTIYS